MWARRRHVTSTRVSSCDVGSRRMVEKLLFLRKATSEIGLKASGILASRSERLRKMGRRLEIRQDSGPEHSKGLTRGKTWGSSWNLSKAFQRSNSENRVIVYES